VFHKIYIIGYGQGVHAVSMFYKIMFGFDRYDPKTDTWTQVASMSVGRDAIGVCLLGDRLFAVGGYDGQHYLKLVEAYDAQNNEWQQVNDCYKSLISTF
jgi:kelch-like protein 1/4/5